MSRVLEMAVVLPLMLACAGFPSAAEAQSPAIVKTDEGYVRKEAPGFEIPQYKGERYDDTVPATLELADMARLALNGLTGPNDHERGEELYFVVNWFTNPPVMCHEFSSGCQSKFLGPLVLNRLISGSSAHLDIERRMIEAWLKGIDQDGLYHSPLRGRPWHNHGFEGSSWGGTRRWTEAEALAENAKEPAWGGGSLTPRLLEAMMIYAQRDPNPLWRETMRKMVHNGAKGLVDRGEWGYFGSPNQPPSGFNAADGWTGQALAQYYRLTGDPLARDTCRKFVYFLKDHSKNFDAQGHFLADTEFFKDRRTHFHALTNCLLAMLEYGLAANDATMKEFARRSFEWARRQGVASIGFFPEFIHPGYASSEGCPVADMVTLALMLSKGGVGDYWDDADRWVRNYFCELQLTPEKAARLEKMARSRPRASVPYHATSDNVTQRNIGAFAGWPGVNEWADHIGIQHCCTGNGARAIYYAWENVLSCRTVTEGPRSFRHLDVNLLLNRADDWADLQSCIPYEGRVVLKAKKSLEIVRLRLPEWIVAGDQAVRCTVADKPCGLKWEGRYVNLGAAHPGDRIEVTFPISVGTIREKVAGKDYALTVKGNTVVAIDPPGHNCPLFQREHFRQDKAPWQTVSRFVTAERVVW